MGHCSTPVWASCQLTRLDQKFDDTDQAVREEGSEYCACEADNADAQAKCEDEAENEIGDSSPVIVAPVHLTILQRMATLGNSAKTTPMKLTSERSESSSAAGLWVARSAFSLLRKTVSELQKDVIVVQIELREIGDVPTRGWS